MPLDPNLVPILQMMEGLPGLSDGTPEEARQALNTLLVQLRDPSTVVEVADVTDAEVADVPVRIYRPAGDGPRPTVVYVHGGGFVIGDLETHDNVCRRLARDADAVVVSVDYRLAPEHVFPAAVEDSMAVLTAVAADIDSYGGDAGKLVIGGDSAGGNLAAVCSLLARESGPTLAAQLLVYPAVDLLGDFPSRTENAEGYFLTVKDMEWFGRHYLGFDETDPRAAEVAQDPRLSPIKAKTLAGLPPAIVATAEFDPLRDEGNAYAAELEKAGVRVIHRQFPGLIHGFYGMEQFSPAILEASTWINSQLKDLLGQ